MSRRKFWTHDVFGRPRDAVRPGRFCLICRRMPRKGRLRRGWCFHCQKEYREVRERLEALWPPRFERPPEWQILLYAARAAEGLPLFD